MSVNLASTTFATGIKDVLAPVDVYSQTSALAPIDSSVESVLANIDTMTELSGCDAISPINQLKEVVASEEQALKQSDIVKGVIAKDSGLHSAYSSMSKSVQNFLTNVKGSVDIRVVNGNVKAGLKMATMTDAGAVTAMLNIVGGKRNELSINNLSGQRNFVSNLLKLSSQMGIPGAYRTAIAGIADPNLGRQITRSILPSVVSNGDFRMLQDIAEGPHSRHVGSAYPNLSRDFASAFRFPKKTTADQHASIASSILSSFNILNPKWNKTKTSKGREYFNGNISLNSSGDFKTAVSAMGGGGFGGFTYSSTERYSGNSIPSVTKPRVVKYTTVDDRGNPVVRYSYPNGQQRKYSSNQDGSIQEEFRRPKALAVDGEDYRRLDNSRIEDDGTMCYIVNDANRQSEERNAGNMLFRNAGDSLKNAFPYTALAGIGNIDDTWFS